MTRLQLSDLFMSLAHRSIGQKRKDNVREYEVHPRSVRARLVAAGVTDEDTLIAADQHDVEEDVERSKNRREINPSEIIQLGLDPSRKWRFNLEAIEFLFGGFVRAIVTELTDVYVKEAYPQFNRRTRKDLERQRYGQFSYRAKLVKLADIADNLADDGQVLLESGAVEVGFNRMFIKEKTLCLPYLKPVTADAIHLTLYATAEDILEAQKKKFDVR